jgi:transposase
MLGKRSDQRGLFEADHLYLDFVGRDSFYGFLASRRGELFRDEEFAELYHRDNGRPSVPPSLMAVALLLQSYDRVSDEEAKERADFDLRWKVALGVGIDDRPFAKSTLAVFRGQLVLHDKLEIVFKRSLEFARRSGYLKSRRIKVALDTTNILGRGAVKDTYNLLADGIVKLARVLSRLAGVEFGEWAQAHSLGRYFGTSLKGEAEIDWDDAKAKRQFLSEIVSDADRLLELARETLSRYDEDGAEREALKEAAELLEQLLLQDIERTTEGASVRDGVARDRVPSVNDPEVRHGHKSKAKRFDGHKAHIAVDTESQLITAATVLPGNASDFEKALDLVKATERNADVKVEETIGDCAYGEGKTRQEFVDDNRRLVAKVPARPKSERFVKEGFQIDPVAETCVCPAGRACLAPETRGSRRVRGDERIALRLFQFDPGDCAVCPLRSSCLKPEQTSGRTVSLHPQEALIQEARALQHSPEFAPYRKLRQAVEHRIARLVQLGIRQARYFGRVKTLAQLLLAATVANLTLTATKLGMMRGRSRRQNSQTNNACSYLLAFIGATIALLARHLGITHLNGSLQPAFQPHF